MIDWLTSKVAMIIAAAVLFASIAGFFAYQRDAAGVGELQNEADAIAKAVNDVNGVSGNTVLAVTFDAGKDGFHMKPTVRGEQFFITINPNYVLLEQKGDRVASNFASGVHLWKPDKNAYSAVELSGNDSSHVSLSLRSGQDFSIERRLVDLGGENGYLTFAYP